MYEGLRIMHLETIKLKFASHSFKLKHMFEIDLRILKIK